MTHQSNTDQQRPERGWRTRAACLDADPELFFPTAETGPAHDAQVTAAKAVCAECPVRAQCLTDALARIPYGIAGGLTAHERRRLRASYQVRDGLSASAREVLADGPTPGMNDRERAGVGRELLASGHRPRQVATVCRVSQRTAERWAATGSTSGGAGEGSTGGHRAPLQTSQHTNAQAGTRAPEGHRG